MQTTDNYPTAKVILCYCLFGGWLGSLIFHIIEAIYAVKHILELNETLSLQQFLLFPFTFFITGIVAIIPALVIGIILAVKKYTISLTIDYIFVFFLGLILTSIACFIALSTIFLPIQLGAFFKLIISGGLSSIIVGKFILPKS